MRVISVHVSQVPDCDEVFNYWEPLHFLHHGFGLQTWEYAPEFSLRSYFYVYMHLPLAWMAEVVSAGAKVDTFYLIRTPGLSLRMLRGALRGPVKRTLGSATSSLTLAFLALSPGMFFCRPDAAALHFCNVLSDAVLCRLA